MDTLLKILYVAGDSTARELIEWSLPCEHRDIAVDTAPDGAAALRHLSEADYDCVISEYRLPDTDGIELQAAINERHRCVPFLLFTEVVDGEVPRENTAAWVAEYLPEQPVADQARHLGEKVKLQASNGGRRRVEEASGHYFREQTETTDKIL